MSFLGSVARLGGQLVRPHDIALHRSRERAQQLDARVGGSPGVIEASVERVVRLGFEVRVELQLADGDDIFVQITRRELAELELHDGDVVWVRAELAHEGAAPLGELTPADGRVA